MASTVVINSQSSQYGGYGVPPPAYVPPAPSGTTVVVQGQGRQAVPGSCRYCGVGFPKTSYPLLAYVLLVVLFPLLGLGILVFIMMKERKCTHCGVRL